MCFRTPLQRVPPLDSLHILPLLLPLCQLLFYRFFRHFCVFLFFISREKQNPSGNSLFVKSFFAAPLLLIQESVFSFAFSFLLVVFRNSFPLRFLFTFSSFSFPFRFFFPFLSLSVFHFLPSIAFAFPLFSLSFSSFPSPFPFSSYSIDSFPYFSPVLFVFLFFRFLSVPMFSSLSAPFAFCVFHVFYLFSTPKIHGLFSFKIPLLR